MIILPHVKKCEVIMKKPVIIAALFLLSACAHPDQNTYFDQEVGKPTTVEFGTVLLERQVDIVGKSTGADAGLGAAGGGAIGAAASHSLGGALVGIVVGGIAGAVAEQAAQDRVGIEYTITLKNKKTIAVVQNQGKNDVVFAKGAHVMVQTRGEYQRVLSAEDLPDVIDKPKSVHIKKQPLSTNLEPDEDDKADKADSN